MQSARVLSLRTAINVLYASLRHKSGAKSQVSVAQQGRIFRNLLGNRIKGSKKRWYPAQDADKFGRSEAHTPSISVARPQTSQKHNNRRVSVLNKLFMTNITDFLATSEISESIVGRGMQVSYVNVTSDFSQVNVYWLAQGDEESNLMLEQELFRCSGQLQHELSQLRLMGEVPRIRFHRDKTGKTLQQVQSLLSKIGEIERLEEAPSEESQEAVADSTENKTSPASWPKMRQDVMNLNRQLIMDKIFIKMRKSREAWASYSREPKPTIESEENPEASLWSHFGSCVARFISFQPLNSAHAMETMQIEVAAGPPLPGGTPVQSPATATLMAHTAGVSTPTSVVTTTTTGVGAIIASSAAVLGTPIARSLPIELQNDQKRRSSSRTIKRKRFDDEIVEYNTVVPTSRGGSTDPNRNNRPRTTSQTYPALVGVPHTSLAPLSIPPATPEPPQTLGSVLEALLPGTPSSVISSLPLATPTAPALPATPLPLVPAVAAPPSLPVVHPKTPAMDRASGGERRARPVRPASKKSQRRNGRPLGQMATKDLGRWKPIDDLALIIGIQQTNDLRIIHRGVKFSCKFTLQELQQRWYALLYEPAVSRIAVSAMRNLHPELVESVQRKALYSGQEEDLLGTIKSTEQPKLEQFQELLDKNAGIFYCARTAKSLHNHWLLLKQYCLLPDQSVMALQGADQDPLSFSDAEDQIFEHDLNEPRDEALELERALADRRNKRDIRLLENELSRWGVLVDSVLGPTAASEFDNQTLACLCGRHVRYLMRSKEITFGRDAKDCVVDVDLSLEGPSAKISRRQGTIKLRSNGDFFIANEGKRAVFIDGAPLLPANKARLAHNCTVEISGLRFTFLVNYELINAIRQESAKTSNPLN